MSNYPDADITDFPKGLTEYRRALTWPAKDPNGGPKQAGINGKPVSRRSCLARLVHQLGIWQQRAQERRQLAAFDERMLHDIGLTRADAFQECRKHFWQP